MYSKPSSRTSGISCTNSCRSELIRANVSAYVDQEIPINLVER